jgi:hypothetical protein
MEIVWDFVLIACAALILLNWVGLLAAIRARRSYSFAPPFVCGILGALAVGLYPRSGVAVFAFVPLVLDPSIIAAVVALIRRNPH